MLITFLNRKSSKTFFSIEKVFNTIAEELSTKTKVSNVHLPNSGVSFQSILQNRIFCKKIKSDIIHLTGHENYCILFLHGKKVLTIHDVGSSYQRNFLKRIIIYLFWYLFPALFCDRITVVSESSKKEFLKLVPFASKKTIVIHNPLTLAIQKSEKKFNKVDPKILFIGTKSNKNLLRCFAALNGISCKLSIVGKLTDEQINALHIHHLTYENHIGVSDEELKQLYNQSDIVSFVSTYEGFGLPIIEGNALGKVVLTSSISSMPEIGQAAAFYVDPFDIDSIRKGYLTLIENDVLRENLIAQGNENCKRFEPKVIAAQYLELYQSILKSDS